MPHDYYEECQKLHAQLAQYKQALLDVAGSEPIPTPLNGWEFCRDVARLALPEEFPAALQEAGHD